MYEGRSCIVGPDGAELARAPADAPALLHAELDRSRLSEARAALPYLRDRRPSLYRHALPIRERDPAPTRPLA